MKKNIFLILFLLAGVASTSFAQDTMHTLVKLSKPKYLGFYFAPEYQYGQAGGAFNSYVGNSAMLILNKKFALGVSGYTNTQESFSPKTVSPLLLRSTFGGVRMEYTVNPNSAVHVSFPLLIGAGVAQADSVSYVSRIDTTENQGGGKGNHGFGNNFENGYKNRGISSSYFVVQPGIHLEANLVRAVKVYVGANYRIGIPLETVATPLAKGTLNGLSFSAGVKVGLFDFDLQKKRHFRLPSFRHKH
jgi:hypothetical protein